MAKILVIEDTDSVREDIIEVLQLEGHEAFGAANGEIGVQMAQDILPNLIVCDITMPVMDGYDVLATIRRNPSLAMIPFIFLTARIERASMRQGMELGAEDYVTKPFATAELLATINTQIEKHQRIEKSTEERLNTLRSNIVHALPHELRTPLTAILGFAELLMLDAPTMQTPQITTLANHILDAGQRLHHTIENYLLYAQLEVARLDPVQRQRYTGHHTLYPQRVITHRANAAAGNRAGDLVFDLEPVTAVSIFENHLDKLVDELVGNAVKFSQPNTSISIHGVVEHNHYTINISDQGRGMTSEQIALIGAHMQFERKMHEQQGSGLGLVLSKQIAEIYGGTFHIQSVPGSGTTVRFTIPVNTGTEVGAPTGATSSVQSANGHRMRVN